MDNQVLYFRTLQTMHLPMASPPLFSLTIPKQQQQQQQQIKQLHPKCLLDPTSMDAIKYFYASKEAHV